MILDEAIKHAEEVAEENQRVVDTGIVFDDVTIDMLYCDDTEVIEEHLANYQRCADEHRQLAEWLKDYKRLLEYQPCGDAISRQAVLDAIMANCIWENEYNLTSNRIKKAVESLPPVTPQPKMGHWIDADGDNAICGCCNRLNHLYGTYCKHCGAKMQEVEE